MTYLDEDMRRIVDRAKLAFVATVRPDNSPSVSPKGSVRVYDDQHLVFMDIASPGTVANLAQNPGIDIAVVDFVARRGYRFTGLAEFRDPGTPEYSWLQTWLLDRNGPDTPHIAPSSSGSRRYRRSIPPPTNSATPPSSSSRSSGARSTPKRRLNKNDY
ncbi:pyridoxamine 5'-phosphate oxidase family protein [Nocardia cyriacigeorgica]|uniref:pyridoxamine 5'-phosphate oxidase family protein n=1 Tax=Nocardia cyriacigeorgica TaxID=135487 RepID=UPI001E349480|nr:pyridoxamine 5'-phosphate oxidase family protein [Nocardia cyriacigeorgica]